MRYKPTLPACDTTRDWSVSLKSSSMLNIAGVVNTANVLNTTDVVTCTHVLNGISGAYLVLRTVRMCLVLLLVPNTTGVIVNNTDVLNTTGTLHSTHLTKTTGVLNSTNVLNATGALHSTHATNTTDALPVDMNCRYTHLSILLVLQKFARS